MKTLIGDKENTPHYFFWGFNSRNGEIYIDARISILEYSSKELACIKMMHLRQRYQSDLNASLIWLPKGEPFQAIMDYVDLYNKTGDKSVLQKLKSAKVTLDDLLRKKEDSNALEFILHRISDDEEEEEDEEENYGN